MAQYTFKGLRLDAVGTIPDDTGIKYYAEAFNGEVYTLLDGINIPLNTATDRIKIGGILRTDNRTKTPEIYRLKLTTIGERPLSNQLDSLQDINTSISNTLSLSSDRAVGQKSILIDHTNTGRGEYIINGESFDVSKLPVISIWVKPLTDYPVSFSIFNPATGRDELIKSDQDGNGYFEIGEDLYENQWNLLLLDLRKAGSNLRGVRDFKVIINEYGTKVLIEFPEIEIDLETVETNIVLFKVKGISAAELAERLLEKGVRISLMNKDVLRAVTHLDVSREDIDYVVRAFEEILKK